MDGNGHFRVGEGNGHRIEFDGTSLIMSASKFFLGGSSQFISGSNSNLEISSSGFHLDRSGNVTLSGSITAISGDIGGFSIGDDLSATSGILTLKGASGQITASKARLSGGQLSQFVFDEETMQVQVNKTENSSSMLIQHSGGDRVQLSGNDARAFTLGTHLGLINFPNRTVPIVMANADEASGEQTYFFVGSGSNFIEFDNRPDAGVSKFEVSTKTFFLGSDDQFVSGSNGNIEISSSGFHLDRSGNATMSGSISATGGDIGGFEIENDKLVSQQISGDNQTSASLSTGFTSNITMTSKGLVNGGTAQEYQRKLFTKTFLDSGAKGGVTFEYQPLGSSTGYAAIRSNGGVAFKGVRTVFQYNAAHGDQLGNKNRIQIDMSSGSMEGIDDGTILKYISGSTEIFRLGKIGYQGDRSGFTAAPPVYHNYGISGSSIFSASFGYLEVDGTKITSGGGGSGDVTVSGTPVDNQIAIWTADDTIEGDASLTFDGQHMQINDAGAQIQYTGTHGGGGEGITYEDF